MRNLLNPKWIFVINLLPVFILFYIFYGDYNVIKSILDEENIKVLKTFALSLGILTLLNFAYAVFLIIKKQKVSFIYGIAALITYVPFLYMYAYHANDIIPFRIPQWMLSGDMMMYVGTFLMPTLAYALLILVAHFTPENKPHKAWLNFIYAVVVPIVWYIFSQIIMPFWKIVENDFNIHVMLICIIVGTLLFLFFLSRALYIVISKNTNIWLKYQLAWKIPIAVVLPLIGLAVNNGQFFHPFTYSNSGVFGDFNNYWFYVLALLNGVFICLPNTQNVKYRLSLFVARSITFAYTFYFFVVFLPYLPLSVIAITAIGSGFLMLTPLLLFIIHINELAKDFSFLKTYYNKYILRGINVVGFLCIPFFITIYYLNARNTLNEALEYLYSSAYAQNYNIDKASLKNTIEIIKYHKNNNRNVMSSTRQPYLSAYFNRIVLDNMTLSDEKINLIEKVFFGAASGEFTEEFIQNNNVSITHIASSSTYDSLQHTWVSQIDFEITNSNANNWFSEYTTTFELPVGAWISDYYLYVGERKEMGILAEKKAAMWVFSNIRNENKDPGILYYTRGNKVIFRVFPFASKEVRKTGIELIHKEPIILNIDSNIISLGDTITKQPSLFENEHVIYIPSSHKESLKKINRKPYFHFVVDVSKKEHIDAYVERIEKLVKAYPDLYSQAQISMVNSYVNTYLLNDDWKEILTKQKFEGGFYIDRAIKTILYRAYKTQTPTYPVIVALTDDIKNAVFIKDFSDWKCAFPENSLFYNLRANGTLEAHSLTHQPHRPVSDAQTDFSTKAVYAYKTKEGNIFYLPDNQQPDIILKRDVFELNDDDIHEKSWTTGLTLQGKWLSQILHPETIDTEWKQLVKYSFASRVMTPLTSYIVVENDAQKAILLKKQEQVLSGNPSLDLGEDAQRMSEPGLCIVMLIMGLFMIYYRKLYL